MNTRPNRWHVGSGATENFEPRPSGSGALGVTFDQLDRHDGSLRVAFRSNRASSDRPAAKRPKNPNSWRQMARVSTSVRVSDLEGSEPRCGKAYGRRRL